MNNQDLDFEGACRTGVKFEVSDSPVVPLVIEGYDQEGRLEFHNYICREDAIKLALTILEVMK